MICWHCDVSSSSISLLTDTNASLYAGLMAVPFTYLLARCVLVVLLLSAVTVGMGDRRFLASTTTTVSLSALGRYDRENIKSPMCNVCMYPHVHTNTSTVQSDDGILVVKYLQLTVRTQPIISLNEIKSTLPYGHHYRHQRHGGWSVVVEDISQWKTL